MNITLIDYNSGNIGSLSNSLKEAGKSFNFNFNLKITNKPEEVKKSDKVILPGVGDFYNCKLQLSNIPGMIEALNEYVKIIGKPFLGICIGMQLMAKKSFERGEHKGLNYFNSEVVKIKAEEKPLKIPHMGWNTVLPKERKPLNLFKSLKNKDFYFVHSYVMKCESQSDIIATVNYGKDLVAVVGKDNILGVQFHPEKSQLTGQQFLKEFLSWNP